MRKHKSGRGSPEARKRANDNYYRRHRERFKAEARLRYWRQKLGPNETVMTPL